MEGQVRPIGWIGDGSVFDQHYGLRCSARWRSDCAVGYIVASIEPAPVPAWLLTTMNRVLFACCLCCLTVNARGDWPEFRGPDGNGITTETGLPVTWSADEHVTWKQSLPGLAWSSPVVVKGKIYLTTAVEEETGIWLQVLCVDAESGHVEWNKQVFRQPTEVEIHKKNSHASPTPLVEGERIYVHFGPHGTACLDLAGNQLWNIKLEYGPTHGNGGSPASAGDLLIICCDGHDTQYVVGVEKSSGEIRWKTDRDTTPEKGFSFSTPLILDVNGQSQAICPGSDAVFAYEPATGKEIWRLNYPGGYSVTPRPIYGSGLVYVCTGYNTPKLLAIDPTGQGDVTATHLKWELEQAIPHAPSPVHVDGLLYVVSDKGIATCLDAKTGEEKWQQRLGGNFSASPLYAEGRVYFQDENGTATVVAAGPEFQELAKNTLVDERTYSSYAVADGAIFLRSEGGLFRLEAK